MKKPTLQIQNSAYAGHYMPPGKLDAGFLGYDDADIVVRPAREV